MDGTKMARIRTCNRCPHRASLHPDFAGPNGYSRFCTARPDGTLQPDRAEWIELHDVYMEGSDGNCPIAAWDGLEPVDMAALAERARLRKAEEEVRTHGPTLELALAGLSDAEVGERLDRMEQDGLLEPEARDALAGQLTGGS
jgi:hypothetical protein